MPAFYCYLFICCLRDGKLINDGYSRKCFCFSLLFELFPIWSLFNYLIRADLSCTYPPWLTNKICFFIPCRDSWSSFLLLRLCLLCRDSSLLECRLVRLSKLIMLLAPSWNWKRKFGLRYKCCESCKDYWNFKLN